MKRTVPIVLAVALFMENIDSTVIATSLATIAADIGTSPIALKLALTSYYVSLAVFIPISGRMADRFGAKLVFQSAIAVFMAGSLACAAATSLEGFVAARFLQGIGGAMMTPVGRLLLVRASSKADLVSAMAWFSIPAMIGPLLGPPIGGAISTYADWRWIFIINLPIGLAGILLAGRFLPRIAPVADIDFDWPGFVLSGIACAGLVFGFSVLSLPALPWIIGPSMIVLGTLAGGFYVRHARRHPRPVLALDLLRHPTLRAAVMGGGLFRIGAGAVPFLFPLMLQLGFGYTPLESGLISAVSIGGAIGMKVLAKPILRLLGFRTALIATGLVGGAMTAAIGLYRPDVPLVVLVGLLLAGGFFRSLFFTSVNVLSFADIGPKQTGDATALVAAAQQVSIAAGVAVAGAVLEMGLWLRGSGTVTLADFSVAFFVVGAVTMISAVPFLRMSPTAGAEAAGRAVPTA